MTTVLVVGASQGIGLETTQRALKAGYSVRALSRSAAGMTIDDVHLEKQSGDALLNADIEVAVSGVDAVILSLGVKLGDLLRPVSLFSSATRVLIEAMQKHGVRRLICVTGFGAGASEARISCLQRMPFRVVFGRAYADKSLQEQLIENSDLEWTIARPGVLVHGPSTRRYKVLVDPSQWRNGIISRADVADFLVRQISDRNYIGQAPVLVY